MPRPEPVLNAYSSNTRFQPTSQKRSREDDCEEEDFTAGIPVRPLKRVRSATSRLIDGVLTPPLSSSTPDFESDQAVDFSLKSLTTPRKSEFCELSDEEVARAKRKTGAVLSTGPAYPRHMYEGWQHPVEETQEHRAVESLLHAFRAVHPSEEDQPEYTYFTLDDFCVYRPTDSVWHRDELVTLDKLTLPFHSKFRFAGVLSFGDTRLYVKDVPFDTMTLEYGLSQPWQERVCVQSNIAKAQDVYYKLEKPAVEYRRFYQPFLVLVQFADYFIEYMCEHKHVTISYFRADFWKWLSVQHADDADFQFWHSQIRLQDFRTLVAVNVEFLWKECWDIDIQTARTTEATAICKNPIWKEIHPERLSAIPTQPVNFAMKTVVTPFAFHCFKSMYFADMLGIRVPGTNAEGEAVRERIIEMKTTLGLTPLCDAAPESSAIPQIRPVADIAEVQVGDVVVVNADKTGGWKASTADLWYAYVQRLWTDRKGSLRMDVIWLYQPEDTTIGNAFYPYSNELFLSDNCGCKEVEALYLDHVEDILGKADVSWFVNDPGAQPGFFVRHTFRTVPELHQFDFITLQHKHFMCCHQTTDDTAVKYSIGDTVLVSKKEDSFGRNCNPAVIVGLGLEPDRVQLQKLAFASDASSTQSTRPNELVFTDVFFERNIDDIVRPCKVRQFSRASIDDGDIPTPYDRDGTGDFFFVAQSIDPTVPKTALNESWDPKAAAQTSKLTGLGIFCGGGAFDRGLEEGGAVKFRYACDLAAKALYSYRANDPHPEDTSYYLGSVNEYLACAMTGRKSKGDVVAEPGSVHVISAGSPCQGFSRLQLYKQSDRSRQNASMVASVISFVDVYAPRYLILENVAAMTMNIKEHGGQNVFSQMIASLVALGYQVQQFLSDANVQGSSQYRPRVFIIASAPACTVLDQPEYTHAQSIFRGRNLGKCSNGKSFGCRRDDAFVPFAQVSAKDSVSDLPRIFDSQTQLCPSHPDHCTATLETATKRVRMAAVPKRPYGMSLGRAAQAGLLRGDPLEYSKSKNRVKVGPGSKSYRRCFPDQPFPTMVTKLNVADGIAGQVLHWEEDRVLTIMEARRAQGYPDHEVLIGTPAERLKIVGNSVDRRVALVLGLALRKSWLESPPVVDMYLAAVRHDALVGEAVVEEEMVDNDPSSSSTGTSESDAASETPVGELLGNDDPDMVNDRSIDNKAVKIWLNLPPEEHAEMRKGGFKSIIDVLSRPENRAA